MGFFDEAFQQEALSTVLDKLKVSTGTQAVETAGNLLKKVVKKDEPAAQAVTAADVSTPTDLASAIDNKKILIVVGVSAAVILALALTRGGK